MLFIAVFSFISILKARAQEIISLFFKSHIFWLNRLPEVHFISPKKNDLFSILFILVCTGTGADVIIVDEAAHIDPQLFYKVIVPILSMKNTSLLCLSSPEGDR